MNERDYLSEVDSLRAPDGLRARVASLPDRESRRSRPVNWIGLAAALALAAGLALAAPGILRPLRTGGDLSIPPAPTESPTAPSPTAAPPADPWGVTLRAEDVTDKGLTLVCTQRGGSPTGELMTGQAYTLERYMDEAWSPVETASGDSPYWTMEGWSIPMDGTVRWQVDFQSIYHTLAPGAYRIGKEIMDFRAPGDYDKKTYYAEFTVVEPDGFSTLDFTAYQDVMTAGEWADMEAFLPVLLGGKPFLWTEGTGLEARGEITLDEFLPQIWSMAEGQTELHLWRLAAADVDGDGGRELVLALTDAGYHYLILHREGDKFYGIDFPVRWFEGLQTNGVFWGSGGASNASYHRMTFRDGVFMTENLANRNAWAGESGVFEIDGLPVDADAFAAWEEEFLVGEVKWYDPIPKE